MSRLRTHLARHVCTGTAVGLAGGGGVGALLAVGFLGTPHAFLAVSGWWPSVATVALASSCLGLAAAVALLPLELGAAMASRRWERLSRVRLVRVYAGLLAVGLLVIHAFFSIAFNGVRDLFSPDGIRLLALAALGGGVALAAVLVWALGDEPRASPGPEPATVGISLVCFLAVAVVCGHALRTHAGGEPGMRVWAAEFGGEPASARRQPARHPWNVLLISIDTLRADHLGVYGYGRATTPHLDHLAARGAVFRNMRSQAPWTLPSHASMLTGLYPSHHGARFYATFRFSGDSYANHLDASKTTLAEMLAAAGYQTAAITSTKWLSRQFGMAQGFDTFESRWKDHAATTVVDEAADWMRDHGNAPFFLFLHFFDVHNYAAPAPYAMRYARPYSGPLRGKLDQQMYRGSNLFDALSPDDIAYMVGKYDGALCYVDAEIGRLLAEMRKHGLDARTLIVVTSDHGEEFWDHDGTAHGFTLYEEQLRVPLIVKPPATLPVLDSTPSLPAGTIDIVPTVLDYLGIAAPATVLDGISLRRFIESRDAAPPRRRLFAEDTFFFNSYAVIDGGLKYITHTVPPSALMDGRLWLANLRALYKYRRDELYRLAQDARETHNVAGEEPTLANRLDDEISMHLAGATPSYASRLDGGTVEALRALGYVDQ